MRKGHSITSSASDSNVGGTARLSVAAQPRLIVPLSEQHRHTVVNLGDKLFGSVIINVQDLSGLPLSTPFIPKAIDRKCWRAYAVACNRR
jgi:hypothetical protein